MAAKIDFSGTGANKPKAVLMELSRYTGFAPDKITPWCTDLWQLRSSNKVSPGMSKDCKITLLAVDEPLVAK